MTRLSVRLFGGFQARIGNRNILLPTKKTQALLAYLAVSADEPHLRDKLSGLLWASAQKKQARHSLRQALGVLRNHAFDRSFSPLRRVGQALLLEAGGVDVDVGEFEALIRRGTPDALERAVALYRGELLEGLDIDEEPFEEWLREQRARLRDVVLDVLGQLVTHHTKAGAHDAAIRAGRRLLGLDPFREDMHRAVMRLYARQGRHGDALRQYQQCVTVLQRDLGMEPSDETKQTYREMLPVRRPGPWASQPSDATEKRLRGTRPSAGSQSPLIGRGPELAELNRAVTAAWRGRGQSAVVSGAAGVGKTRLMEELAGNVLARRGRVLIGRAFDTEQTLALAPWVDVLRSALKLYEEAGVRSPNVIWRAELAKLLPELGGSGAATAVTNSLRLFESVAHLLRDLASRWPLVLILENLHWADDMSVRLFTFLANRIEVCPLGLFATIRDEELIEAPLLRRFLEAADASHHVRRLDLAPLSRDATSALVRALAARSLDAPALVELAEQVWFLSEGNSFLIVEIMRAAEIGEARTLPTGLPLPERVRQVVAARLERLGDPAQRLIAVAATVGHDVEFALLQRAAGLDDEAAADGAEELVRRRMIQPVGERFDFIHHTVRSVVYLQLPPHRRKDLHQRVAVAMEELYHDDLPPHYLALARHFSEAEMWPRALGYLWKAGLHASDDAAHPEAVLLFTQALELLTRLPKSRLALEHAVDLHIAVAQSHLLSGEPPSALKRIREAELLATSLGDKWRLAWVLVRFSEYFRMIGEHDRAIGAARRADVIATTLGDATLQAALRLQLAHAYHAVGEYREAMGFLADNLLDVAPAEAELASGTSLLVGLIDRESAALVAAASRTWFICCLAETGRFDEALRHGLETIRVGEAGSATSSMPLLLAYLGVGHVLVAKGQAKDGIVLLEQCREMRRRHGADPLSLFVDRALASAYLAVGLRSEAVALMTAAVDEASAMKIVDGQSLRLVCLSEALLAEGRAEEARQHAMHALELASTHKERGHEAYALRLVGDILAHGDVPDLEAAQVSCERALALATELGMRPLAAQCYMALAKIYRRSNELELARAHLADAVEMSREMEMAVPADAMDVQ